MKLVRFKYDNKILWGSYVDNTQMIRTSIEGCSGITTFQEVVDFVNEAEQNNELYTDIISQIDVQLLAPVMPTKNVLCIGKNYYDHILEFDGSEEDVQRVRETPIFFSKAISSITGPFTPVLAHKDVTSELDYEAELAIVIGKAALNVSVEDAYDYVFGYTILNDITSRDLQRKHQQWLKGKSLDTHCPIGPWVVDKDSVGDPQQLAIKSIVNGEVRQDANTDLMIHSIKALISGLSQGMTLNPGDIIATGTPKGVGMGYKPPRFLKAGDEVEIVIENIGSLVNLVK